MPPRTTAEQTAICHRAYIPCVCSRPLAAEEKERMTSKGIMLPQKPDGPKINSKNADRLWP